ncbi:MAG: hypothetical protein A4E32_02179 [Methanomassiliicoccales archaeon PtaU1.Bin124]|nr:MAG: hypothetical protein A4E32_02179 [Methanomassiliicoccales archaeon PtaU1.Bin124]
MVHGRFMNLTNESYLVKISGKNATEYYYKEKGVWYKVSYRGRRYRATAEQILNHVLPSVAGIKENISIVVEHYEDPEMRPLPPSVEEK